MEPTGTEPVSSCLQSAREDGRLRVELGCLLDDGQKFGCRQTRSRRYCLTFAM
jgi:hypothetical protein